MSERKSFLDMTPPEGYIPGLGRGATGFTTRSDIGPARTGIAGDFLNKKEDDAQQNDNEEENDERFQDPENEEGLFASSNQLDAEDEEAERIYNEIDRRMEERHKKKPQKTADKDADESKNSENIAEKFVDLKRALGSVTEDQWANLPDVGDLTRKYKRQRKLQQQQQRFYAVPDMVLESSQNQSKIETSIKANDDLTQADGTMTDFRSISSARDKMLGMKLDQARSGIATTVHSEDSSGGFTNVDPKGYLTSLTGSFIPGATDIGDVRRIRPLLKSLVATDPKEPRGWIGLARLEELASHQKRAIAVIEEGCQFNPYVEDVWLEYIRLTRAYKPEDSKKVASKAVQQLPTSIKLWQEAANLETDTASKRKVIQMALENNPKSDTLWREAVNLENDPSNAKLLLAQAVELVPLSEDLWLALARLETPSNARKVLNKARKMLKVSRAVWIAAARLEEQTGGTFEKVEKRIQRGVKELEEEGGLPERSLWISDAEECEREGSILTCKAIISHTIGQGIEEENRKSVWLEDGKLATNRGSYETARAIYWHAIKYYPESKSLWFSIAQLEKEHGKLESLFEVLEKAVSTHSNTETFWLTYAREKVNSGDPQGARDILKRAFEKNPNNEDIWLAAITMEAEDKNYDEARILLRKARVEADTESIWVKSVELERQLNNLDTALTLATQGLEKYPKSSELWVQKGQIYQSMDNIQLAISTYKLGTRATPKFVPLWLSLSELEEKIGNKVKARSTLETAALTNEKNEKLWVERVRLEKRMGNETQAKVLLSRALQELPKSGLLWSELILLEQPMQRRTKIREAVAACENDPALLVTIAREFWRTGKQDKAKVWFERSIQQNSDYGDAWLWYYKFLVYIKSSGNGDPGIAEKNLELCLKGFLNADPRHGDEWPKQRNKPSNFGKNIVQVFKEASESLANVK